MIRFCGGMTSITHPPITGRATIWVPGINLIS
jgi:hypothetical protein